MSSSALGLVYNSYSAINWFVSHHSHSYNFVIFDSKHDLKDWNKFMSLYKLMTEEEQDLL